MNCRLKRPEILEGGVQVYGTRHCPLCVEETLYSAALVDLIRFYLILSVPVFCLSRDQRAQERTFIKAPGKTGRKLCVWRIFYSDCLHCTAFTCTYTFEIEVNVSQRTHNGTCILIFLAFCVLWPAFFVCLFSF